MTEAGKLLKDIFLNMKIINQIRQYFIYLPVKDRKIAENLLDGRKFAELKELVDSDVVKITEKRYKLLLNDGSGLGPRDYWITTNTARWVLKESSSSLKVDGGDTEKI